MIKIISQEIMQFDPSAALPMFIIWIVISTIAIFLIIKNKMSKKSALIIYTISLLLGGILLGALPNPVMPIQIILLNVSTKGGATTLIMPMIIILIILLLSVVVFGRLFCGYACPLGALQELASKLKFKSSIKEQKDIKYKIDISYRTATIIRWVFFIILIIGAIFWSIALLQIINPFLGFKIFTSPGLMLLLVPAIFLGITFIASFFIYRPWCRLFCPFGALASLVGYVSLGKLTRTDACTDCGLCEKICPTHQAERNSGKSECYYCNRCIDICPSNSIFFKIKR
ncbi:MAG: 4Fe-4S binding protein [Promethearchaeota archaeon]